MATGFAAYKVKAGSAATKALMLKGGGAKGAALLPIKAFGLIIGPGVWLPMAAGALGGALAWSVIKAYEIGKTFTARGRGREAKTQLS
jgi:hypothetical protein